MIYLTEIPLNKILRLDSLVLASMLHCSRTDTVPPRCPDDAPSRCSTRDAAAPPRCSNRRCDSCPCCS